ncbi:MAG: TlyA family RNA methyltransferase [Chloroflexota bacterium]|nr:TlyA family RNA methyltransferase [Chloroflexota bacterium]
MKRRLDVELVRRGLAPTRAQARQYVRDGFVRLDGAPARRPGRTVATDAAIEVDSEASLYVGRGGRKLAFALDAFGLDPRGLRVLDVGAGTGGFTDLLLQRGAAHVIAVDVGHGQLAPALRHDPRVDVHEGADIREVDAIEPPVDAVVVDVSFIRLRDVLGSLVRAAPAAQWMVLLLKPQFELPGRSVPADGVVKSQEQRDAVLHEFQAWLASAGYAVVDTCPSPVPGVGGNRETFVHLTPPWPPPH